MLNRLLGKDKFSLNKLIKLGNKNKQKGRLEVMAKKIVKFFDLQFPKPMIFCVLSKKINDLDSSSKLNKMNKIKKYFFIKYNL